MKNPGKIPMPLYSINRHPIETWQEWYLRNQKYIDIQVELTSQAEKYGSSDPNCM